MKLIGEDLYYTISLSLVNFLTTEKKFRIVKVKRDFKNSYVVYFYFVKTDKLMEAIEEFKKNYRALPEEYLLERLKEATDGVWSVQDGGETK